ncbi:hypothetical protein [Arthrobacter oryzae]|uniref:hypothetical protein n=1 Tax=Arthrobacter oryzae TaxID=409290 RepID=UPI00352D7BAA
MSGRELTLLAEGRIELLGRMLRSSNETFLVRVSSAEDSACAVYKPEAGERPLHDFEPGLYRRERAAYLLSEHLRWNIVPPTVIREDSTRALLKDITPLAETVPACVAGLLDDEEVTALQRRVQRLLRDGVLRLTAPGHGTRGRSCRLHRGIVPGSLRTGS